MNANPGNAPDRSANIFINYRREDSAGHAGRLFDRLNSRLPGRVFMDIDTLEPGVDFVEVIERAVGACEVLIVLIGHEWLRVQDAAGRRRLDDPEDFVRLEVAKALERKIRVIPVLVQGAPMPRQEDLPPDLTKLARRNAIELSDARWTYDVDRLIHTIEEVLNGLEAAAPVPAMVARREPAPAAPPKRALESRAWIALLAALALSGAGWTGWKTVRHQAARTAVPPAYSRPVSVTPLPVAPRKVAVPAPAPVAAPVPAPAPAPVPAPAAVPAPVSAAAPSPRSEKLRVISPKSETSRTDTRKDEKHRGDPKHPAGSYVASIPIDIVVSDPIPVSVTAPAAAPVPAAAPAPVPAGTQESGKTAKDPVRAGDSNPSRWKKLGHALLGRRDPPAPAPGAGSPPG